MMQRHVRLLRSHALGSFGSLLQAICRDPAMLIGLGADANRKAAPNDGFVRPLLETFTLGTGCFTEHDVREAARAFTGWFVLRGQLRYIPQEHDGTAKRVLGQQGNFTADDVMRIVLEQPATSRTVVRQLYRWLISETEEPHEALIAPLAESFAKDYNVAKLVETMLRSNLFFSSQAYRQRIKCPVELAVGIVKALEGMVRPRSLPRMLPISARTCAIRPRSKAGRAAVLDQHRHARGPAQSGPGDAAGAEPYGGKLDPWAVAQKHGYATPESAARFLLDLLLQGDLEPGVREALLQDVRTAPRTVANEPRARGCAASRYAVTTLPEYHLA